MTTKLSVSRTQWAVGNGFFHSGVVSTSASTVSYVYDCGALGHATNQQALRREVSEYGSRNREVDFMFISHFDFDHVSGVPLLTQEATIGRFIIPLVTEPERLFMFAGNLADGSFDETATGSTFYEDLIVDPRAALEGLTNNNVAPAVVQIVEPAQVVPQNDGVPLPELLAPRKLQDAVSSAVLTLSFSPTRIAAIDAASANRPNVVWEWVPYVATRARGAIPAFLDSLVRSGVIRTASDLTVPRLLARLVRKRKKELVSAYDDAIQTVGNSFTRNLTSLMVYSGPAPGSQHRAYRSRPSAVERAEIGAWDPRPGWLALGDADLRSASRVDEVNAAFRNHKPLVGTFAPSHHGSRRDWRASLMEGFDANAEHQPTYVFGASGAYRSRHDGTVLHPDGQVLLDINEAGGIAITVGLSAPSRWTESLHVFVEP